LSALGTAIHLRWRGPVNGNLGHPARRGIPYINPLPGLTGVTAAEQRSCFLSARWRAATTRSRCHVDDPGIVWGYQEATAVRTTREHLLDLDMLPTLPTVTAAEHGDLRDDVDCAWRRGTHLHTV